MNGREIPIPLRIEPAVGSRMESGPKPVPGVAHVVLVASGKGGVGKSTLCVNLACTLADRGLKVGLLDADLHGPSVAQLLGTGEALAVDDQARAIPCLRHRIWSLSLANALPPEEALVWKGPLVQQVLEQMFFETRWPDLDILLVDMPPGTGDVYLALLELVAADGALIVTTPQRAAVSAVARGISLFHELDVPVFGVIENMATLTCPCCGEEQAVFADGGIRELAEKRSVAYWGALPMWLEAVDAAASGVPLAAAADDNRVSRAMQEMGERLLRSLHTETMVRARAADTSPEHEQFWRELLDGD